MQAPGTHSSGRRWRTCAAARIRRRRRPARTQGPSREQAVSQAGAGLTRAARQAVPASAPRTCGPNTPADRSSCAPALGRPLPPARLARSPCSQRLACHCNRALEDGPAAACEATRSASRVSRHACWAACCTSRCCSLPAALRRSMDAPARSGAPGERWHARHCALIGPDAGDLHCGLSRLNCTGTRGAAEAGRTRPSGGSSCRAGRTSQRRSQSPVLLITLLLWMLSSHALAARFPATAVRAIRRFRSSNMPVLASIQAQENVCEQPPSKMARVEQEYLRVKRLSPEATLPTRGSAGAAGYDLSRCVRLARARCSCGGAGGDPRSHAAKNACSRPPMQRRDNPGARPRQGPDLHRPEHRHTTWHIRQVHGRASPLRLVQGQGRTGRLGTQRAAVAARAPPPPHHPPPALSPSVGSAAACAAPTAGHAPE